MELSLVPQLKNLVTIWLLVGNGLLMLWAGGAYGLRRPLGRSFFSILLFLQILVAVMVASGAYLLIQGLGTNAGHIMYGLLNAGLAVVRLGFHGHFVRSGRGGTLWHGVLAFLALALIARSSVTALYA